MRINDAAKQKRLEIIQEKYKQLRGKIKTQEGKNYLLNIIIGMVLEFLFVWS